MTHKLVFLLFCFVNFNLYGQEFIVNGKLKKKVNGIVYLQYVNRDGLSVTDSCFVKSNFFVFKGAVNEYYGNAKLKLKKVSSKQLEQNGSIEEFSFGLENRKINILLTGEKSNPLLLSGNVTENEIAKFYRINAGAVKEITESENTEKAGSLNLKKLTVSYKTKITHYCSLNQNSKAAAFILFENASYFSADELRSLLLKLSQSQQSSYYGNFIQRIIYRSELKHTQVGITVKNFKAIGFNGDSVTLYNLTSKGFVLLDFWASWCNPCRASSPLLRSLHQKYKKYGFEIIGISCDEESDEQEWKKAILQDSVFYWPQILTTPPNKEKSSDRPDLLREYEVSAFPTLILLDKNNRILARIDGSKGELERKLKEVFGE